MCMYFLNKSYFSRTLKQLLKNEKKEFPAIQWSGFCASTALGLGSVPSQGTNISQAAQNFSFKKKKNWKKKKKNWQVLIKT